MKTWHVAILATVGGVFLHAFVIMMALGDGDSGETAAATTPTTIVTAPAAPSPTPQPTLPPDRTSCEEIRDTEYRSFEERDWFRANCITPTP